MGLDQAVSGVVAGIGFRAATTPDEIATLLRRALAEAGLAPDDLAAIATAADRAGEPNLRAAAAVFHLIPVGLDAAALAAADPAGVTRSDRIVASRGIGSVAEAAALAGAGPRARLLLARIASAGATCALARRSE
ncbi:cobalamin biosynthesis protein [Methylorubrum suomiense]|uniref:cobalamin biosynthesis protein n=1 Tax=Methylorubrum suomiense TaxID=144191 RepID=UPI0010F7B576|nr:MULTISPECIES: cobalamin biosynthesis protein [Methylobacteriaceae]